MEIKKQLKVDAESFFKVLERSLRYDVEHNGSKKIKNSEFEKGFKYSKKVQHGKKEISATISLLEYQVPTLYKAKFMSELGGSIMQYTLEENPKGVLITYTETSLDDKGEETSRGGGIQSIFRKRGFKKQLKDMEKDILNGELEKAIEEESKETIEDTI